MLKLIFKIIFAFTLIALYPTLFFPLFSPSLPQGSASIQSQKSSLKQLCGQAKLVGDSVNSSRYEEDEFCAALRDVDLKKGLSSKIFFASSLSLSLSSSLPQFVFL